MTAARSTRTAIRKMPVRLRRRRRASGGGGRGGFRGPERRAVRVRRRRGGRPFRPVRRPVRRQRRRGGGGGGPFSGFGRRSAPPQKGADVAYRLDVPFEDAAALDGAARHAGQRQDARHQAAAGRRGRHQDPPRRPGPAGPGGQWRRDRHHRDQAAPLLPPRGRQYPARPAGRARRGGARRQGPGADRRRAGDAEHPQGLELGQGAAPQGQGLHRQERPARRPARHPDGRRARTMPSSPRFLEGWSGRGKTQPAGRAGRLGARARHLPRIPGSQAQAARQGQGAVRDDPGPGCSRASRAWRGDQAGRDRRLFRRLHPRRQPRLSRPALALPVRHRRRGDRPAVRPDRGGAGRGQRACSRPCRPTSPTCCATPIRDVLEARSGNLLWLGALVGLWTTGSFIETIRDIIRRAYGVTYSRPFWEYRLGSVGMIIAAVVIAMIAFSALDPAVGRAAVPRRPDPGRRRSGRPADPAAGRRRR